ncbi:Ig-like domain-containing protein [Rubrivivax gelatinosus]|uniref:Ig-like domain-containing protein n=1 Tax=Rubrivivax gelatinosus TaxID=28068 RepID=UPI0002EF1802|nr:Ig-like domain-containing protein [Rubrivivax gelatinosus]MBG6080770.1 hypothetical protein [Rubrivivax gelatinosus]
MSMLKRLFALFALLTLAACGGGSSNTKAPGNDTGGSASITVSLSSSTVTAASPATVTARLKTAAGKSASGVVVTFSTANNLGSFSATTALSDADGVATVTLSPASSTTAGADTVVASAEIGSETVTASKGFSLVASSSSISSFTAAAGTSASATLSAYGQTELTLGLSGVSTSAPATVAITSSCVTLGKATISPTSTTTTISPISFTYKDNGCGSSLTTDTVTATVSGTNSTSSLVLYTGSPEANNIVFVRAAPEIIYLQGSGFTTSSTVVFQVNDRANNPLPNQAVTLDLTTYAGGLTIEGSSGEVVLKTNSVGQVSVLVNSGTVPTPVRVKAKLGSGVSTVSSKLTVAVGLPSQLNFSLSQKALNIEGGNYDGTPNTYTIYAADRSGNPVPDGTVVNFWAEGGQIEAGAQTAKVNGLSTATVNFVSQSPRPDDGRLTIVAYALGEESFIDLNGNNVYDTGEPFQDLGDVLKDKLFDNVFDPLFDEYVSLNYGDSSGCVDRSSTYPILSLTPGADAWIPNVPRTCDGKWTPRPVYVRRAVETVISTSSAGALWVDYSGLSGDCKSVAKQSSSSPSSSEARIKVGDDVADIYYSAGARSGSLLFSATDANSKRFNPMAAGTVVSVAAQTAGLTVKVTGGSPVISTLDPFPPFGVSYAFADDAVTPGIFTLSLKSPASAVTTTYTIKISTGSRPSACTIQ